MSSPVALDVHHQTRHEFPVRQAQFLQGKGNLSCSLLGIICVFDLVEPWKIRMFFISSREPSKTYAIRISHFTIQNSGSQVK